MRILYSFPHAVGKPGIGTTAFHQVAGAIRQGIEVILYCTSLERKLEGVHEVVETLSLRGRRLPHRALGVARAYRYHDRRVARALRTGAEDVELVHCWPSASIATFRAARARGIPCLREVPNTHTGFAFDAVARETAKLSLDPVVGHSHTFAPEILAREELEYSLADLLLVPSDFARRTFIERGVPEEKLALHRYGFDPGRFYPPPKRSGPTSEEGLRALFVGSCEPRKGLHYALQAWIASGAAEGGRFVVCGDFVSGYRRAVTRWLEHPSVDIRGFVSDPGPLMRENDVFIFPSVEEGSAIVTYEAQASGCVLVVSDATGALCEHGRQGLIHPAGDLEMLTRHIRMLNEDRILLDRLRRGTLAARSELTWEKAGEHLAHVYGALALRDRHASAA
jgi:glycosyltransferase involved in cell wall biosynthesis